MHYSAVLLLALSMSADAFAAAIARGAALGSPKLPTVLKIACTFGFVETLTPLIGWGAGSLASAYIEAYDHWIAFALLGILGVRMVREGLSDEDNEDDTPRTGLSPWMLVLTAIATSIDSMVVGVGLAFLDVDIWTTALTIGATTTLISAIGVKLGNLLGNIVGKRVEIFGGIVLVGIGAFILLEHLNILKF